MLKAADFPVRIWIQPTNHCNLACPFCPHKNLKRPKGFMPLDRYQKLIDEIYPHKLKEFWLQSMGESTLHPDLIAMICYAAQKGVHPIFLSTNCTTLSDELAEDILVSGLDYLILSLDGASKETFERLRAGANYEKVVENIKNIFLKKKKLKIKNPVLILQIVYSEETKDELEAYLKQWSEYMNPSDQISLKAYNDFAGQVEVKGLPKEEFTQMPCRVFFNNLIIHWDGVATPCCLDIEADCQVGNVFESTIEKVWNGEAANKLREAVNKGDYQALDLCRKCTQGIGRSLGSFIPKKS